MDARLRATIGEIRRHYGDRLVAIALFGSRVRSRPRNDSDWDLLLVLGDSEPIRRVLYREWDEHLFPRVEGQLPGVSPHFVHLPRNVEEPSALWLEVAAAHEVLSDPSGRLDAVVRRIRELIDGGRYERRAAHGLSYWRKAG